MIKKNLSIINTDLCVDSLNLYLSEINKYRPLSTEEESELWVRMSQGDKHAREALVKANLRYVINVAKEFKASKAPLEDLIQAGNEGLVKAANNFDGSRGFRFISYATWYIENEVRKAANYYMQHNDESLDEPITYDDEEDDPRTRVDNVRASLCMSADWNVRYYDLLEDLKRRAEDRQYGFSRLIDDFYQTMENGGDTAYFARKHRLNEKQMKRFLTILREEAKALCTAA